MFMPFDLGSGTIFILCWVLFVTLFFGAMFGSLDKASWRKRLAAREAAAAPVDPAAKFCPHCRWARWDNRAHELEWKCAHESAMRLRGEYLATGQHTLANMHSCAVARTSALVQASPNCGSDGRYWERKQP